MGNESESGPATRNVISSAPQTMPTQRHRKNASPMTPSKAWNHLVVRCDNGCTDRVRRGKRKGKLIYVQENIPSGRKIADERKKNQSKIY